MTTYAFTSAETGPGGSPVRRRARAARARGAWFAAALALIAGCREAPRNENVRRMEPSRSPISGAAGGDRDAAPSGVGADARVVPRGDGGTASGGQGQGGTTAGGGATDPGVADAGVLPTPAFTKRRLLEAAAQCAVAHYRDFAGEAGELVAALQALAATPLAEQRARARAAFAEAAASWQRAELFRVGPAARAPDPGALDLRDQIYAFPLSNACLVDRQLVSELYADAAAFADSAISARGLAALEYLLFHDGQDNACAPGLDINAAGTWTALSGAELAQRRAEYALAAARDVEVRARALLDAWDDAGGGFARQFVAAGEDGSVYPVDQAALNALNEALFYVEIEVKDYKLGTPLGLIPDCPSAPDTCPELTESRHARASADHLRQNLIGARRLFEGCGAGNSGIGFDDWLTAVGAHELRDDMLAELAGAQRAVDELELPLEQALTQSPEDVHAVHAAVKRFTDLLKTTFVSVLDLELPQAAEGDND